jgi:hypothetical protein
MKLTQRSMAVLTIAIALIGVSQAHAASSNITDDPAYRNYLRWNGFDEDSAPSAEKAGTTGQAGGDTRSLREQADQSYIAYQRLNGFSVPDTPAAANSTQTVAQTGAGESFGGSTSILADPSYIAYERLNGLL